VLLCIASFKEQGSEPKKNEQKKQEKNPEKPPEDEAITARV